MVISINLFIFLDIYFISIFLKYKCIFSLDKYDDYHLVSGGNDYVLRIWDIENTDKVDLLKGGHSKAITSIACLGDEKIVSGDERGIIIIWGFKKKNILFKI